IVANILLNVNLQLMPQMLRRLRPGATLILSGLIDRDARPMETALRNKGITEFRKLTSGEWVCFVCAAP
ncbi:MAG TPA: 50S ribosomal protein L11 methyltransferase, partial [candidate division Zixibacteria bacterium]|nr:50S ribosomal protein L11 methyltransferase [candidate division Zixibacteria bacterium]